MSRMQVLLSLAWVLAALIGSHDADTACLALGGLDVQRAHAFAEAKPALLGGVYATDGAAAPDRRVLSGYRRSGIRLIGAVMIRESCAIAKRTPHRIELDVVDRLGPALAIDPSGRSRPLPHDLPTRHLITLVQTPDGWRIDSVQ